MTDGPEPDLDAVFKALNDPTRRAILDALRARDGQSLTEIESDRALSRFGVMKHLMRSGCLMKPSWRGGRRTRTGSISAARRSFSIVFRSMPRR
jgi:DNA-binding transcriptional ArsR family regulator